MRTKLRNGEEVVYLARKHWITLVMYFFPLVLAIGLIAYTKTVHSFDRRTPQQTSSLYDWEY